MSTVDPIQPFDPDNQRDMDNLSFDPDKQWDMKGLSLEEKVATNLTSLIFEARKGLSDVNRGFRQFEGLLEQSQIDSLKRAFHELEYQHESQAYKLALKFVGAVLGIPVSTLSPGTLRDTLDKVGQSTMSLGDTLKNFGDSDVQRLQDLTQELQQMLQKTRSSDDELIRLIREIMDLFREASKKYHEMASATAAGK